MNHNHDHTHNGGHHNEATTTQPQKGWKAFIPLIALLLIVIAFSAIMAWISGNYAFMELMRWFMGGFFMLFGLLKVINLKNFAIAYSSYDIIAKRTIVYGYIYPFIELGLAIAYITSFSMAITNGVTLVIMLISAIGVMKELLKKNRIPCACLGMVFVVPMTTVTLIEDLLMAVMAATMLILS